MGAELALSSVEGFRLWRNEGAPILGGHCPVAARLEPLPPCWARRATALETRLRAERLELGR